MSGLQSIDNALFRFINLKLSNPVFDAIMPGLSSNGWFIPALIFLGVVLCWKGGVRGRFFVVVLLLSLALGDALVINNLKHAIGRPRPFTMMEDARVLVGLGRSISMPSSHAAIWAAAALIALIYYPRSRWFLVPFAFVMAFSRVYLGVHYPSDVLVGGILGAGYAAGCLWAFSRIWEIVGRRWFPLWWERQPTLVLPRGGTRPPPVTRILDADREYLWHQQWLRLGYILIALALAARLFNISSDRFELSEDEAYQWVWSKHLALSYYSKPPMIALAQFTGTTLWGDTAFGVRFLSPVLSAIVALCMLRFIHREASARVALVTVIVLLATPMLTAGSSLMTIDPLLVAFWTGALVAGWRAVQPKGATPGLGLGGPVHRAGLSFQIFGAVSRAVLCPLFLVVETSPRPTAKARAVDCASAPPFQHDPGARLECAKWLGHSSTRLGKREAGEGMDPNVALFSGVHRG